MIDMDGGKVTWGAYTLPITEDKGNIIVFKGDTEERTDSDPPIVLHYSTSGTNGPLIRVACSNRARAHRRNQRDL